MKVCRDCGETKPFSAFYEDSRYVDGYRHQCRECHNSKRRARYVHTAERALSLLRDHRRRAYRLSPRAFAILHAVQFGGCAICGKWVTEREANVDHCHRSGKVRGLLCRDCNLGLGNFKDDPALLALAIKYLQENE